MGAKNRTRPDRPLGQRNCECDVRLSADDKILLLHDETLERLVPEGSSQAGNMAVAKRHVSKWVWLKTNDIGLRRF